MGGWIVGPELAIEMVKTFLSTAWCQDLEDWRAGSVRRGWQDALPAPGNRPDGGEYRRNGEKSSCSEISYKTNRNTGGEIHLSPE